MSSPVGLLSFGIVVICVISVKSGVSTGNYQTVHGNGFGYPGPIFQGIIPTNGFRSAVPKIFTRRVELRSDDFDENEWETHRGENEGRSNKRITYGPPHPHQQAYDEEDDEDYEEDKIEDDGENEHGGVPHSAGDTDDDEEDMQGHGRQAYNRNNNFRLNAVAQKKSRKSPDNIRNSLQAQSRRQGQRKANIKKILSEIPEEVSPVMGNSQNSIIAHDSQKQKLQLKAIANSHGQFVATPIADLILRLSISLAKPIGYGNGTATYLNVPIRLFNTETEETNSSVLNGSSIDKMGNKIQKANSTISSSNPSKVVGVPIKTEILENDNVDDKEDEDDIDPVSV